MPITRRSFIKSTALLSLTAASSAFCPSGFALASGKKPLSREQIKKALRHYKGKSITVASWGGSYQAAQRKAFFEPFSKEFGIRVLEDSPAVDSKIIAMVNANSVTWDVVDTGMFKVIPLGHKGVLEELDYSIIDNRGVIRQFVEKWGIGTISYSELLTYRSDVLKHGPKDIDALWDVQRWPGKRGLRDNPISNLAFALEADGVARGDIYPLNDEKIKRAYKKLDEIKEHALWWKQNAESPEWVANKEVQMATAMNGRLDHFIKEGVPVELVWKGAQLIGDGWVIPKGAPEKEIGMLFIAWASLPEINWQLSKYISYGPVNKESLKYVPNDIKKTLPTSYTDKQVICDFHWWGEHYAEQVNKWRQWTLA